MGMSPGSGPFTEAPCARSEQTNGRTDVRWRMADQRRSRLGPVPDPSGSGTRSAPGPSFVRRRRVGRQRARREGPEPEHHRPARPRKTKGLTNAIGTNGAAPVAIRLARVTERTRGGGAVLSLGVALNCGLPTDPPEGAMWPLSSERVAGTVRRLGSRARTYPPSVRRKTRGPSS